MDLKEKLLIHRLKKKYESWTGIKSFRIASFDDITQNERKELDDINRAGSLYTDKLSLNFDYKERVEWVKQKVRSFLNVDTEIIIFDNGHLIVLFLKDIELFLQEYLEDRSHSLDVTIISRWCKTCVKTHVDEYDILYFEREI